MPDEPIEVVGIGAPFVDYIVEVSDEFISKLSGAKGGMEIVDFRTFSRIIDESGGQAKLFPGGSSANTIRGLACLGHRTALIGRIGKDDPGKRLLENLSELGIKSYLVETETPTAQAICLITTDGERTLRSFLGASQEMSSQDLRPEFFEDTQLVHIEGYSMLKGDLTQTAMELAQKAGTKISFDLGSFEVVNAFKEQILHLLSKYTNIVFANRDEITALTKLDPEKGCRVLGDICETVVVLLGAEGCLVAHKGKIVRVPAQKVTALDTTGAGDLFASGFLHGYLKNYALEDAAYFGTLTGGAVVQVSGVVLTPDVWETIKTEVKTKKPNI